MKHSVQKTTYDGSYTGGALRSGFMTAKLRGQAVASSVLRIGNWRKALQFM